MNYGEQMEKRVENRAFFATEMHECPRKELPSGKLKGAARLFGQPLGSNWWGKQVGMDMRFRKSPFSTHDVVFEVRDHGFLLGDDLAQHIANGEQAEQLAIFENRQVPDAPVTHHSHAFLQ